MKSLAIVSSYDELCGNATYTRAMAKGFAERYHVEVLPLKTHLLRSSNRKAADAHIDEIAKQLGKFDHVNIQFEAGLYGAERDRGRVSSRVGKLIDASPNLVFTMHRIEPKSSALTEFKRMLGARGLRQCFKAPLRLLRDWYAQWQYTRLTAAVVHRLKQASRRKNVWLLVHTKRDSELIRDVFQFDRVVDFPLTYLSQEEKTQYLAKIDRPAFLTKYSLPPNSKTIGVFGFLSSYKGFDTVIESMRFLPPNYHLLIFGGQHPLSIRENTPVFDYIDKLIAVTLKDPCYSMYQAEAEAGSDKGQPIPARVHFLGAVDDESFNTALSCCDRVVLPYLEVGQGMSAIAVLALETRARALFANNLAVRELQRYAPGAFPTFDMGNYLELAEKIRLYDWKYEAALQRYVTKFNLAANIDMQAGLFEGRVSTDRVEQSESMLRAA